MAVFCRRNVMFLSLIFRTKCFFYYYFSRSSPIRNLLVWFISNHLFHIFCCFRGLIIFFEARRKISSLHSLRYLKPFVSLTTTLFTKLLIKCLSCSWLPSRDRDDTLVTVWTFSKFSRFFISSFIWQFHRNPNIKYICSASPLRPHPITEKHAIC